MLGTMGRPRINLDRIDEITERYQAGEGLTELAAAYGTNFGTLRRRLLEAGVQLRPKGKTLHPSRHMLGRKGAQHPSWKGGEPNYNDRHQRVEAARGKATGPCEFCRTMETSYRFEWAQLHGTTGNSPDDYIVLCRVCHEEYDVVKISAEKAKEIRTKSATMSQTALAQMYSVSPSYIHYIIKGKRRNVLPDYEGI